MVTKHINLAASVAAQSHRIQCYVAHLRKNLHRLPLGDWDVLTFTGKKLEFVKEAKKYHVDIVRVSSPKRHGSGIIELGGWKLFDSGADPSMSALAGVRIFTRPQLSL